MEMRAAVLDRMSAAQPYAVSKPLRVAELELDPPGRGEVLVRIAAAGLCHSDLSVINGDRPRPMPMALGHEAAGAVKARGDDVPDLVPGTTSSWCSCRPAVTAFPERRAGRRRANPALPPTAPTPCCLAAAGCIATGRR